MAGTICIPKAEYLQMKNELKTLRNTELYKRLLEFEENIQKERFSRADLGF